MKRFLFLIILLAAGLSAFSQSQVDTIEIFFDVDPGLGKGAQVVPSAPGPTISEAISAATDTLSPGFHIMGFRVKSAYSGSAGDTLIYRGSQKVHPPNDSTVSSNIDTTYAVVSASKEQWSMTVYKSFYVGSTESTVTEQLDTAEYFFDKDPGVGNGTIITSTPAQDSIALSQALSSDTLSPGFHIVGIRVKGTYGNWSIPEYRSFLVSSSGTATIAPIDSAEYFFDSDPGYENGTKISVTQGDTINQTQSLASNSLGVGFHTLGVRVKDNSGNWSLIEYKSFYVGSSGAVSISPIDSIEYFFDNDPGANGGTIISLTAADTINTLQNLSSGSLTPGFHSLGVRVRAANGIWSIEEFRSFYVGSAGSVTIASIDSLEYFIDSDPGAGAGTIVSLTPADTINTLQNFASGSLPVGFHSLGLRVHDVGGKWSIEEYRSFYIGSADANAITPVDSIEYFFDNDPGVGNGITLTFTPADSVTQTQSLASDTLSVGFHTLALRVRDQKGNWSTSEYRSFYISSPNALTISPLTKIEYFYDNDPGFGSGTQIPASGDSFQVSVNIPSPGVAGTHTLTVRALNARGEWSLGEIVTVNSLNPGRKLDSLALVELYNTTNGPSWTNRNNWLTTNIDFWYGVTLSAGRVDSLNLNNNKLTGKIPKEFAYITALRSIVLSNNTLTDSLPFEVPSYMTNLQYADLSHNKLNGLPDLSSLGTVQTLKADNNFFDFGDLEPNASIPSITYIPQGPVTQPFDSVITINQLMSIGLTMSGTNNYQWYGDSVSLAGANTDTYIIPSVTPNDSGNYYCLIDNPSLPGLTLSTAFYHLRFSSFTNDSLALVLLYDSTGGPGWTNHANWLTGPVGTWVGVTMGNGNVRQVSLPSNNLNGSIPHDIFYLDSLEDLDLSGNKLSGLLPVTVNQMSNLRSLNISSNAIDSIPALNLAPKLDTVNAANNKIQFDDIEVNLSLAQFTYSPQDSAGAGGEVLVDAGKNYTFKAGVRGLNNLYQWFKNGTALAGKTATQLLLSNVSFANEGNYTVRVTNSIVPGLTIYTKVIALGVSSLQRDSLALVNLYQVTHGDQWTDKTGWDSSNRGKLNTWIGVVLGNNRIKGVILPNNNLTGIIPDKIRDITQLDTLDVHGNKLTAIPFVGTMDSLASFDVSHNQIGFEYLIPDKSVPGFVFNPQDSLEGNLPDTIPVGTDLTLRALTRAAGNSYSWFLNGAQITGAVDSLYTIKSIQRNTTGSYYAKITNATLTGMPLFTKSARILAKAAVTGKVTDASGTPITSGTMRLFKIKSVGGFDTTNIVPIGSGGIYTINNVLLDDYILGADADTTVYPDLVPSYFGNTIYWEEADTIPLSHDTSLVDIKAISKPAQPTGSGSIFGLVEEDLPNGRIERRTISRATVSVTLTQGGQRLREIQYRFRMQGGETLIEVTETDDNGNFTLNKLDTGFYRINVQYPGIPMDQTTNVILQVGSSQATRDVQVSALVTITGIKVTKIQATTGLEAELARNYNIYPVPAKDYLMIESINDRIPPGQLSIVDMNGREMFTHPVALQKMTEIDVHQYYPGLYILRIIPDKVSGPIEIARIIISR